MLQHYPLVGQYGKAVGSYRSSGLNPVGLSLQEEEGIFPECAEEKRPGKDTEDATLLEANSPAP